MSTLLTPEDSPVGSDFLLQAEETPWAYVNLDQRAAGDINGKPSLSVDQAATRLTGGEPGWNGIMGTGFTVS